MAHSDLTIKSDTDKIVCRHLFILLSNVLFCKLEFGGLLESEYSHGNPTPSDKREQSQLIPHGLGTAASAVQILFLEGLLKARKTCFSFPGENV